MVFVQIERLSRRMYKDSGQKKADWGELCTRATNLMTYTLFYINI